MKNPAGIAPNRISISAAAGEENSPERDNDQRHRKPITGTIFAGTMFAIAF